VAVTGSSFEAALVAGLERAPAGVTVVRRCVDLADLLAAASTGTATAALLSADLHRLDRDALSRLGACGVAVVGLHAPGDEPAQARLRQLGVTHLVPADASPDGLAAAVATACDERSDAGAAATSWSRPLAAASAPAGDSEPDGSLPVGSGRLIAVWGPTGAPGRTTVAVGLAGELAATGVETLLADADVYGGVVAQVLGLLDESPGLAAAARLANSGSLDLAGLARLAARVEPGLRVLTGMSRAERWPELRPAALERVWELARRLAPVTVVDCGFCLEQDEELVFDAAAPRRNGATLATLAGADVVVAVGAADPVGVQRLVRGLAELREAVPDVVPRVVLNRVRRGATGGAPHTQLRDALRRYAGVAEVALVPDDRDAVDAAVLQGRRLGEVAPGSAARRALAALAAELTDHPAPARRRRGRRRVTG
jgi:MinD-like ATPase involved in chromosome partitioning or flagellar assembly